MSAREAIAQLEQHVTQHIIGQEALIRRMIITLLADGHLLVEG
ncbi:MAG: AAA family ATPase, partial [Gammaproteobacteria bacterium]|nr:AAA family ATPase [Gammaproteobacteria bacterium]